MVFRCLSIFLFLIQAKVFVENKVPSFSLSQKYIDFATSTIYSFVDSFFFNRWEKDFVSFERGIFLFSKIIESKGLSLLSL